MDFAFTEDQLASRTAWPGSAPVRRPVLAEEGQGRRLPEDFYRAMADAAGSASRCPRNMAALASASPKRRSCCRRWQSRVRHCRAPRRSISMCSGPTRSWCSARKSRRNASCPISSRASVKGCFAVTEPDAAFNTTALDTKAERDGNGYIVNGKKNLHDDGLGCRQDAADRAHHAQGEVPQADRRPVAVLHRPGSLEDRGHRDRQDGPQGDRHQPDVHRRPQGAARGSHRPRKARASTICCMASTPSVS